MKAVTIILLAVLACAAYGAQVCKTEEFGSFGCDINIPDGSSVFDGKATMAKTIGASPLAVYQTLTEACEFSFGPCSTLNLDSNGHSILVASDNVYEITFTFTQKFRTFSVGKIYGLGVTDFKFKKNGNIVLSDTVNRDPGSNPNIVCEIGTSASWAPAGGFDQVVISGGIFALTDLSACYNGAVLFTGGVGGYTAMQEDVCTHCVDALRINYWKKFTCNDSGACQTRTFLGSNCTSINFAVNTLSINVSFLQTIFPRPNTVCVVTGNVPSALQKVAVHEEL